MMSDSKKVKELRRIWEKIAMNDYKFGDEVQIQARNGIWTDARYIYHNTHQHITLRNDSVGLYYTYSDDIRRRPRTEKRMMQWLLDDCGHFMALEAGERKMRPFVKSIGEPFEKEFEVPHE